jgi:hypothetical protein
MRNREQDEAALNLGELAGTIDRVREMLGRLAQPQRGAVARALWPSIIALDRAVALLRDDALKCRDEK